MLDDPLLTIGQIAQRSGVRSSALRFYEERGLITSVRASSGHRRYPRSTLRRVAFIVFAQRIGFSLDEIVAQLAALPEDHVPTGKDWRSLSMPWRHRLDERIAELERLRDSLDQCIGCGCLSMKTCRLNNPDDAAGARGPGARRWLGDPPVVRR